MTLDEKMAAVETMLTGPVPDDEALRTYLDIAASEVLARVYPYDDTITEVPDKYAYHQVRIAAYFISKRGALGQTTHTESGTQRQYESASIPASLLRGLVPNCGVIS